MAVYILSAMLIIILAFAIYQLSKKSEVDAELKTLKKRNELSLMEELRSAEKVVWLCFIGGLLLTANYAITYFSGSELKNIPEWGFIQWSGAFMGLVIAVSITFIQKVLYSSPTHSKAGLIVTTLVLIFVIISEIGAPIEKEGMKMKEASQNSAVFKAVVNGITGKTDAISDYSAQIAAATAEKAQHQFERQRCKRHAKKGEKRVKRCENFENSAIAQAQAKIDSYQSSASATANHNESQRLSLINEAKALEHNTDHHSELVKLTASILGANFLDAMMFLSLVLIVAFEAGFHFVGSRVGLLKTALGEMGNKEILRAQELVTLKNEKRFKDKAWNLKGKPERKTDTDNDNGYAPATALHSSPKMETLPKDMGSLGIDPLTMKAANEDHHPQDSNTENDRVTLDVTPLNATVPTVGTRSDKPLSTVGTRSNEEPLLSQNDFDDLYDYMVMMIKSGSVNPTVRPLRKVAHAFIKDNTTLDTSDISFPKSNKLMQDVINKMLNDEIITINPEHKNGTAKYMLKEEVS